MGGMARNDMLRFAVRCARGDEDAAGLLLAVADACRLADNIVDGDSKDPAGDMARVLDMTMCRLPTNAFYRDHPELASVIYQGVLGWSLAEDWKRAPNRKTRMFGFVYRELIEQITYAVAYLTGGHEHARAMALELHALSHGDDETLEDWEAEHGMV